MSQSQALELVRDTMGLPVSVDLCTLDAVAAAAAGDDYATDVLVRSLQVMGLLRALLVISPADATEPMTTAARAIAALVTATSSTRSTKSTARIQKAAVTLDLSDANTLLVAVEQVTGGVSQPLVATALANMNAVRKNRLT